MDWTSDYIIGLPDIDEQHKQMALLITAVETAIKSGREHHRLIVELARFASYHFGCEELMMKIYEYPRQQEHTDDHRGIEAEFRRLVCEPSADPAVIQATLRRCFTEHTRTDDLAYAVHVRRVRLAALRHG